MLTLWGPGGHMRYCDGRSRRSFLKIGGLAMGGLGLPGLLQAETRGHEPWSIGGPRRSSHKSVIMIYLSGGAPHQDTFDLKPERPTASAASSSRSRPGCPASRSASCCPGSPASWTRSP